MAFFSLEPSRGLGALPQISMDRSTWTAAIPCKVSEWPAGLAEKRPEDMTEAELLAIWGWCTSCPVPEDGAGAVFVTMIRNAMCSGVAARLPQAVTGQTDYERATATRARAGETQAESRASVEARYPWLSVDFAARVNEGLRQMLALRQRGKALLAGSGDCQFDTGMIEFDAPCGPAAFREFIWRADVYATAQGYLRTLAAAPPASTMLYEIQDRWIRTVRAAIQLAEAATATQRRWLYPTYNELSEQLGAASMRSGSRGELNSGLPLDVARYLSTFGGDRPMAYTLFINAIDDHARGQRIPERVCIYPGTKEDSGLLDFTTRFACRQDLPGLDLYRYLLTQTAGGGVVDSYDLAREGGPFNRNRRLHEDVEPKAGGNVNFMQFPSGPVIIEAYRRWAQFFVDTPYDFLLTAQVAPRYLNAFMAWGDSMARRYGVSFEEATKMNRADLEALQDELTTQTRRAVAAAGSETLMAIPVLGAVLGVVATIAYGWFFALVGKRQCPSRPPIMMTRTLKDVACTFDPNQVGIEGAYTRVVEAGKSIGLFYPDPFRRVTPPPPGEEAKPGLSPAVAAAVGAFIGLGAAFALLR